MKKFSIVIITLTLAIQSFAQMRDMTPVEKRRMNACLLELVDKYDSYSRFEDMYFGQAFQSLFADGAVVNCDFPSSLSFMKAVTPREYTEFVLNEVSNLQVDLYDVKRSDYVFEGGTWNVDLLFDRKMSYTDAMGLCYDTDASVVVHCEYIREDDIFRIKSIAGHDNMEDQTKPWYMFPGSRYCISQKSDKFDSMITVDGKKLSFNDDGYAYTAGNNFRLVDDDVVLTVKELGQTSVYTMYGFDYKPLRWRTRAHFDYAPAGAYDIKGASASSSAWSVGIDLGYMWSLSRGFKLGFYTGLGMTFSNLTVSDQATYSYSAIWYNTTTHVYETLNRAYDVHASQSLSMQNVYVPLYLASEIKLAKFMYLTLDAGARLNLNTNMKDNGYVLDGTTVGGKPFSDWDGTFLAPSSFARNTYDISVYGRGGFDFVLGGVHSVTVKAGYEFGITPTHAPMPAPASWFDNSSKIYPIVYSPADGKDVVVRSFADCITFKRKALWIEVGYKLKF